jgi:hypothetical protein
MSNKITPLLLFSESWFRNLQHNQYFSEKSIITKLYSTGMGCLKTGGVAMSTVYTKSQIQTFNWLTPN